MQALHVNASAGCVTLTTGGPVQRGAEIFLSYGERPNEVHRAAAASSD